MKIAAIFGIGWAVAIVGWLVGMAVGHTVVAIRDYRHARQVVKGAERFLATYTTDPATWPNAKCVDRQPRILWVRPIAWDDETR